MTIRETVSVAYVKKAHALDGELFVQLETDYPHEMFVEGRIFRVSGGGPIGLSADLTLENARPHTGGFILKFAEIGDRDRAESYEGRRLSVPADELVELGENEYFLHDLEGVRVLDPDGEPLGEIQRVHPTGGRPLLVVGSGDEERLVPFVRGIVEEVDLEEGVVRVRPPSGLLEL